MKPNRIFVFATITALLLLLLLASCGSTKHITTTKNDTTKTDDTKTVSTTTTTEIAIKPLFIDADSAAITLPLKQLIPDQQVTQDVGNMTLTETIDKAGNVHFKAKEKVKTIQVPISRVSIASATTTGHEVTTVKGSTVMADKQRNGALKPLNFNYAWWLLLLIPAYFVWRKIKR